MRAHRSPYRSLGLSVLIAIAVTGCQTSVPCATPLAVSSRAPYANTTFTYQGTNPRTSAWADRTSTFGVDVDDGAYVIARTYLEEGRLPDRDGIRVEEFVNHFDYRYPRPIESPVALLMDSAPSPFEPDTHVLRCAVSAGLPPFTARAPRHLTFLIDTSGSMARESRLSLVKYCVLHLVDQLGGADRISVVSFGDRARVEISHARPRYQRDQIWDVMTSLAARGGTNLARGLEEGYRVADAAPGPPGASRRIVLCSDGVANLGTTGVHRLVDLVRCHRDRGVPLSVVGFGLANYDDTMLEQLANAGDGAYAYVHGQADIDRQFGHRFLEASDLVARDVKVQVEFDPGVVRSWRLLGDENRHVADEGFRDARSDGGELGGGQSTTALYLVRLQPGTQGPVATFRVHYEEPSTRERREVSHRIYTCQLAQRFDEAEPGLRLAVAAAQFAEILRESSWVRGHRLEDVRRVLAGLPYGHPSRAEIDQLSDLVERAIALGWGRS